MQKVLVTGGSGLLGRSLQELRPQWFYLSSDSGDLSYSHAPLVGELPDVLVHLAAKVGGIQDNVAKPYEYLYDNCRINENVIDWCREHKVPVVYASSSCVYPHHARSYPLTEDQVDTGPPEPTNASYAYAKRHGAHLLRASGLPYCILYFSNLYGKYEYKQPLERNHLVMALIKKFWSARDMEQLNVELFGNGRPLRQFTHASDAARVIVECVEKEIVGEYNVGTPEVHSVREIADIVRYAVNYGGTMSFNGQMNGVFRKDVSDKLLQEVLGSFQYMKLYNGVIKTVNDLEADAR